MSVEALAVVLQHAPFSGRDKLVLVGIANHDGDGGSWPAISTLARYANCSPASVKRSLAVLETGGAITKLVQAGGTIETPYWARTNRYEINVECPANCDKSRKHRPIDDELPAESMLWINPGSLLDPGSVVERGGGSVVERGGGSVVEPLTILKPSKNTYTPAPRVSTSPERGAHKCWACGQNHTAPGSYCTACSGKGRNNPWINCTDCPNVRKRNFPGQQSYTCTECKQAKAALDHDGATS